MHCPCYRMVLKNSGPWPPRMRCALMHSLALLLCAAMRCVVQGVRTVRRLVQMVVRLDMAIFLCAVSLVSSVCAWGGW